MPRLPRGGVVSQVNVCRSCSIRVSRSGKMAGGGLHSVPWASATALDQASVITLGSPARQPASTEVTLHGPRVPRIKPESILRVHRSTRNS